MKNYILFPFLITFLFSACSFKLPDFLTFSGTNYEELLKEADVCQNLENDANKLECYKKIETTNSFAKIRLGTNAASKKEYKDAIKYLNEAKEQDNLYANLPLASMYYQGEGVRKDINKSFELLNESSDIDPVAAFQLSKFYLQGINTKINNEKGINLLTFAAQKGVYQAQEMLANIYKQGLFEQAKDQIKHEFWLKKIKQNKEDLNHKVYIF